VRVAAVALARLTLETTAVLMLLGQGRFLMGLSALLVGVAALTSYGGALLFGLTGAAAGGLVAYYVEAVFSFRRISRLTRLGIGELQDWRTLGGVLFASVGAAAVSWWAILSLEQALAGWGALAFGTGVFAAGYWAILELMGYGWLLRTLVGPTARHFSGEGSS
jgi:hypothetical protein